MNNVTGLFVARIILTVIACVCAFFLFRVATDVDLHPWLAVGAFGCTIGALFPWPA